MKDYEIINIEQKFSETDTFTTKRYEQFYKSFPKNTIKILDIGCNTGRCGEVLKRYNNAFQISGLDIVQERLNKLPTNVYNDNILGSSTAIPIEDDTFDVVVAGEFIEHLYARDVDATLFEIFRILKIGGRVLLTTPTPMI